MKQYIIQVRDRVTGQGKYASDPFDNFKDAVEWAKEEYGPREFEKGSFWHLETFEILKGRCPYYVNAKPCEGDVLVKDGINKCQKCGREIPPILEM